MSSTARWPAYVRSTAVLATCVAMAIITAIPVEAADVWFAPFDPLWRSIHGWPANDYMQLFKPDAPWQTAARGIKVFQLTRKFAAQGSDNDLGVIIKDLSRRHIALAVSGTPLIASQECGMGVEGYGPRYDMAVLAARLKRLGGTIAYVALDEPLYFGHQFNGRPMRSYETRQPIPCHSPIDDLARQAATKMAELHQVFSGAIVGDVEPVGPPSASSATDLADWLAAYQAASGAPFGFVGLDVVWPKSNWPVDFDTAVATVRKTNIPLGVIYNGTPEDPTDAAWIEDAKGHIQQIESKLGAQPDIAIFQSWIDRPERTLPETAPDSFTGLIKAYLQHRHGGSRFD